MTQAWGLHFLQEIFFSPIAERRWKVALLFLQVSERSFNFFHGLGNPSELQALPKWLIPALDLMQVKGFSTCPIWVLWSQSQTLGSFLGNILQQAVMGSVLVLHWVSSSSYLESSFCSFEFVCALELNISFSYVHIRRRTPPISWVCILLKYHTDI